MHLLTEKAFRFLINIFGCVFLFCLANLSIAKNTLFVLPDQGAQLLVDAIASAQSNLQITMYGFTNKKIARALIQQRQQGVHIQLLIESEPYKANNENTHIIQLLQAAGIEIHYASKKFALTHQKTLIIDQQRALILTDNFTYSGLYHQRNFIVDSDEANVVNPLIQLFNADWHDSTYIPEKNSVLMISPDNSWKTLSAFLRHTHAQLDIYASALTDKRIIHELLKQTATIRIIVAPSTKIFNQRKLCQHHIYIHELTKPTQHAKALLRDYDQKNELAYVGSVNLSYPSLSKNREVGILFSDKEAIAQLHTTFEKDWRNSHSICR